jgi:hypothetical protein
MRRKPGALPDPESHAIRVAWWASFLATIALIAILGIVRSAQAAPVPIGGAALALVMAPTETSADSSADEEEVDGEECEVEEDSEECEEDAATVDRSEACILRSASATVTVLQARNQVRLALRYTALSPALVSVEYSLRGRRGRLKMGEDSRRFSRRGVFHDTETLSEAEMAKVEAATEFDVRLHAANTPRYCRPLFDRDLKARHAALAGPIWTD